jgi:Zn-dependent peptidase ImmA (M78 family)
MSNFIKKIGESLGLVWALVAVGFFIAVIKYAIKERMKGLAYDRREVDKLFHDLYGVDTSKCKIVFESFKHFKDPMQQNAAGYYLYSKSHNTVFINEDVFSKYGDRDQLLEEAIAHELQHYCQYVHKKHILVYDINHALANSNKYSYEENPLEKESLHIEKLYRERERV